MNTSNKNNSVLSISSNKIKNCKEVLSYFFSLGIPCSITDNNSVVKHNMKIGDKIIFVKK